MPDCISCGSFINEIDELWYSCENCGMIYCETCIDDEPSYYSENGGNWFCCRNCQIKHKSKHKCRLNRSNR